jgi:hypothetical protein
LFLGQKLDAQIARRFLQRRRNFKEGRAARGEKDFRLFPQLSSRQGNLRPHSFHVWQRLDCGSIAFRHGARVPLGDPATLTEDQLRQYFLFLREHKHYSRSPMKMAKYALLSFFVDCLKVTGWTVFK